MHDDDTPPDDTSTEEKGKILQYRRPKKPKNEDHRPVYINDKSLERTIERLNLVTIHLMRLQEQLDITQTTVKYFSIISGSMLGVAILLILLGSG